MMSRLDFLCSLHQKQKQKETKVSTVYFIFRDGKVRGWISVSLFVQSFAFAFPLLALLVVWWIGLFVSNPTRYDGFFCASFPGELG